MKIIAHIRTDFPTKFGVPRQAGVVESLTGRIVFEPEYRNAAALKGLEGFSHIWLIWQFSKAVRDSWSPTVRPPRLGGNARMGVFATRSPFRPNPIGLSCVKLERVEEDSAEGPCLHVSGVDLMDGTPIYDIKPYIPYADCKVEATAGFTGGLDERLLEVECEERLLAAFPAERKEALLETLSHDPRPSYQDDPQRIYGMAFAGFDVRFTVAEGILTVREILPLQEGGK